MVWTVFGDRASLGMEDAVQSVHGTGHHEPFFSTDSSVGVEEAIDDAEAYWSFHPHNAPEVAIDPMGRGLLKRIQSAPEDIHFMIEYLEAVEDLETRTSSPMSIGFAVCLPPSLFHEYFTLWKDFVFRGGGLRYVIQFDYVGFRVPEATTDNVTVEEWMKVRSLYRKAIFGKGVSVSFLLKDG